MDKRRTEKNDENSAKERPTLKTLAFMTGLGVTTVSRALKDVIPLIAAAMTLTACDKTVDGIAEQRPESSSATPPISSENPFSSRNQCALLD